MLFGKAFPYETSKRRTGPIPVEQGDGNNRQQSDYEDFFTVEEDIVNEWISQSDQFISAITVSTQGGGAEIGNAKLG